MMHDGSFIRPHSMQSVLGPIQTQYHGLSVCVSVVHDRELCIMAAPIEMPLGWVTRVSPMNDVLDGV